MKHLLSQGDKYIKIDLAGLRSLLDYFDLDDEEIGRLFTLLLEYADSGAVLSDWPPLLIAISDHVLRVYEKNDRGQKGQFHWNWKGGITPQNQRLRGSGRYRNWRDAVFARDDYTCQCCGQRGGVLNAHHISPWAEDTERRFDVSNGITLCERCHKATHAKIRITGV